MAAKKKNAKKKASTQPKSARPPRRTGEQPEPVQSALAEIAAAESDTEPSGPPIVAMGASAGGLDAFKRFFTAMPANSGIAFVLIPHLDPKHESLMVELIGRHTATPVVEVVEGMLAEADHIYIIPPNRYMTISGGVLRLTGPVERGGLQTSIDLFLRSLADDQRGKAICIILSGTGSHGTLGLKAVKGAGGMAMVQDPATADYARMPQSAVDTGLADYILPVEKMPEALLKYVQHSYFQGPEVRKASEVPDQLNQVLALLRARTEFDFRFYRKKMLARRIERRMGLRHHEDLADYLTQLRANPEEVKQLARDLLISVTSFFRDPEAFHDLQTGAIAPLVASRESDTPLRVWVPGCATGEEAYSLSILLLEQLSAAQKSCPLHIFATDVNEEALEVARHGVYPDSISADVSAERLARYFTRMDQTAYQVNKQVREPVVFARQNLIRDAPFSKIDLISCRNLLIYLEPEVQKKVLTLLHFALNESGYLFLGPSETVGRDTDLFEPVSKKWRIFRRIGPIRPDRVEFPIARTMEKARGLRPAVEPPARSISFGELTQRLVLEHLGPAAVLINRKNEVLYFLGPTTRFLDVPPGEPTQDLLLMAPEGLRSKLRAGIYKAQRDNEPGVIRGVQIKRNGGYSPIRATVKPVRAPKSAEGLLVVVFEDEPDVVPPPPPATSDDTLLRQLEFELRSTKEDLQSTIEEMESANEELKASNEEVMSMNEELQSTNEELETSKEELQSLNEEMSTVNSQLQDRVQDLEAANNDINNLVNFTDIATVFLDAEFHLKRYTPASTRLFRVIPSDVGRPISDIVKRFADDDLLFEAQQMLRDLAPREKEVRTEDGHWYARRIIPYRTLDNRIDGVLITFMDITERKKAADVVVLRLATIVEASLDGIFSKDLDGMILTWNRGAERVLGYTAEEAVGRSIEMFIPADRKEEWITMMGRLRRGESIEQFETERIRKDGRRIPLSLTISPIMDSTGKVLSASVIARDISERKRSELALRASEQRFRLMADAAPVMIWTSGPDRLCTWFNKSWLDFTGRSLNQELGNGWAENIHADDFDDAMRTYAAAFESRKSFAMEYRLRRHDGAYRWIFDNGVPLYGVDGKFTGYIGSCIDLTERKQTEQALIASDDRMRAILSTATDAIITIDQSGIIQSVNLATEKMFGYAAAELIGQNVNLIMPALSRNEQREFRMRGLRSGDKRVIGVGREVQARRKDGSVFPGELAISEIKHLNLFTGILRDITQRKDLEREVVEIAALQQRRIGQDLHDSVGQELTALSMRAKDLAESLASDPAKLSSLVKQLRNGLERCQKEFRTVLHGLLPVPVDNEGLMGVLAEMAEHVQQEGTVQCVFDCPLPVSVANNSTATHLYLIAQEALHNAVKHAQPKNIRISLTANANLVLSVQDDGTGMSPLPADKEGLGLRIMQNRAAIIGAILTIEPVKPSGTKVTCELPRSDNEAEEDQEKIPNPDRR